MTVKVNSSKFTCEYCKKSWTRENSFLVHLCTNKMRVMNKDEKYVKLGFMVYQKFWNTNYKTTKPITYEHFMKSNLYTAFVKFGKHLLNINAINIDAFVDFLIKTNMPIDKWTHDAVYENYVRELNKKETYDAALERSFLLMQHWANETNESWTDFFRKISPVLATQWIRSGRISPWIFYNASSSKELLARMSDEQLELIDKYIDPNFWSLKFKRHMDEIEIIQQTLNEIGV